MASCTDAPPRPVAVADDQRSACHRRLLEVVLGMLLSASIWRAHASQRSSATARTCSSPQMCRQPSRTRASSCFGEHTHEDQMRGCRFEEITRLGRARAEHAQAEVNRLLVDRFSKVCGVEHTSADGNIFQEDGPATRPSDARCQSHPSRIVLTSPPSMRMACMSH